MKILVIFALLAIVSSKDLILIGDSRYVGMAALLMGFDYSTITDYYGTGTNIRSVSPKSYGGFNVHVTAQVSASYNTYTTTSDIYKSMHSQLSKANAGAYVLMWLGINNVYVAEATFNFYANLAKTYPTLKFYGVSVTGVNEQKITNIQNSLVTSFNDNLKSRISKSGISNLSYLDILKSNNPTQIVSAGNTVDLNSYSTDGLHYNKDGYSKLFAAMVGKLS